MSPGQSDQQVLLGLRENWRQFALLVATNAFVGGMVGLERTILPLLAEAEFAVASRAAAVSFIATFALAKAIANLLAGHLSERLSRRTVLILGWLAGLPVPFALMWAPNWSWVIAANLLLGLNQGLAWSMTANMKMDLVGPRRRGLAMGVNEAAGYVSVAAAAFLSGLIAQAYGLRPEPFYLGVVFVACGLALSTLFVRDTRPFVALESGRVARLTSPPFSRTFAQATWRSPHLFALSQAGFVKNLNDALAWGVFPLFFASQGLALQDIAVLAGAYPLVWGVLQLGTGWASDRLGRKSIIVGGMLLQGLALSLVGVASEFPGWLAAMTLLGVGTALVYPTLQAAVGDAVPPEERATTLGVYRFWRDAGAIAGALGAGALADLLGFGVAIQVVAALTVASGVLAAAKLRDVRPIAFPGVPRVER